MSGALAQPVPFEARRVPLERRVTLKFQHREGFVNEYAANVSLKGMFITAWVPEPPGSVFLFEVRVADRQRLIHGVGEVVWVREAEDSPDAPAGMGIRFLKLDDASREVIAAMVEDHVGRGGMPFDPSVKPADAVAVDELFEGADQPRPPAAGAERPLAPVVRDARLSPAVGRAMARRSGRGLLLAWLALAALLAASALLVLLG